MRDIYNPPPAPVTLPPEPNAPVSYTRRDVVWLSMLIVLCFLASWWAWTIEPTLGPAVLLGTSFVSLESWFSSLTFLHRHPAARENGFWRVFLAAFAPWALGLGAATAFLIGLFAITDWARFSW